MHKNVNRIVILTAGKVGSLTIKYSLQKTVYLNDYSFYHGHGSKKFDSYWHGMSLADYYNKNKHKDNWYFIVGIRDPIECYISSWYENNEGDFPIEEYKYGAAGCWWLSFLDREYKDILGIDLYMYDFNIKKGYSVYKISENVSVLVYKLNKLNDVFGSAMYDLLGISNVKMINQNFTCNKSESISKNYKHTLEQYRIKEENFKETIDHKYMKHFFSDEEIDFIKNKWVKQ
jgi:hypothetical protein